MLQHHQRVGIVRVEQFGGFLDEVERRLAQRRRMLVDKGLLVDGWALNRWVGFE